MKIYKKIIIAILSISLAFSLSFYDEKRIEKVNALVLVDDLVVGAVVAVVLAYTGISLANANKDIISDVYNNLSSYSKEVINNIELGQKYINDGFQTMMAFTYNEITMMINDIVDYFGSQSLTNVGDKLYLNEDGQYIETVEYVNLPTMSSTYKGHITDTRNTNEHDLYWHTVEGFTGYFKDERNIILDEALESTMMLRNYIHSTTMSQYLNDGKSAIVSSYTSVRPLTQRLTMGIPAFDGIPDLAPMVLTTWSCSGDCIINLKTYNSDGTTSYTLRDINGFVTQSSNYLEHNSYMYYYYALDNNITPELANMPSVMLIDGTLTLDPPLKTNEPSMGDIDVYDSNTKVIGATQLPLILLGSNLPLNGYDDLNGLGHDNVVVGDDQTTPFDDTYPDIVDHVGENDIDVVTDVGDTDLVTDTNSLADWLAGILSSIFDGIVSLINGILDWLSDLFGVLQSILSYLGTMLGSIISAITGAVTSLLTGLYNLLYSIFGQAIELFMGFFNALWKILEFLMRLFIYYLQHLYDLVMLIFTTLFEKIPLYIMGLLGLTSLFAVLPTPLDLIASSVLGISVYMVFLNILFQLKKKGK